MRNLELGFNRFASYFSHPAHYTEVLNYIRAREETLHKKSMKLLRREIERQQNLDRYLLKEWFKKMSKLKKFGDIL